MYEDFSYESEKYISTLESFIKEKTTAFNDLKSFQPAEGDEINKLDGSFQKFHLYNHPATLPKRYTSERELVDYFAQIPPIESFMNVSQQTRKDWFFKSFRCEDILIGQITDVHDHGLNLEVICADYGLRRDLEDLKIIGFCPAKSYPYDEKDFHDGDKIRVFISEISSNGKLILGMNTKNRSFPSDIKFGLVSDDNFPINYIDSISLRFKHYEEYLEESCQTKNPKCPFILGKRLGIPKCSKHSMLKSFSKIHLSKEELGVELRKMQLRKVSMKKVKQGIKFFKEEKYESAKKCYDVALDVESTNPSAFVAISAICAMNGEMDKAIAHLEKSYYHNPAHADTIYYLTKLLNSHSQKLAKTDRPQALKLLKRSIKINPTSKYSRELLHDLTGEKYLSDEEDLKTRDEMENPPVKKKFRPTLDSPKIINLVISECLNKSKCQKKNADQSLRDETKKVDSEIPSEQEEQKKAAKEITLYDAFEKDDDKPKKFMNKKIEIDLAESKERFEEKVSVNMDISDCSSNPENGASEDVIVANNDMDQINATQERPVQRDDSNKSEESKSKSPSLVAKNDSDVEKKKRSSSSSSGSSKSSVSDHRKRHRSHSVHRRDNYNNDRTRRPPYQRRWVNYDNRYGNNNNRRFNYDRRRNFFRRNFNDRRSRSKTRSKSSRSSRSGSKNSKNSKESKRSVSRYNRNGYDRNNRKRIFNNNRNNFSSRFYESRRFDNRRKNDFNRRQVSRHRTNTKSSTSSSSSSVKSRSGSRTTKKSTSQKRSARSKHESSGSTSRRSSYSSSSSSSSANSSTAMKKETKSTNEINQKGMTLDEMDKFVKELREKRQNLPTQ